MRVIPPPPFGAAGDGDVFADGVVVADLEASGFACVFEVLRGDAETGEGEDAVVAADGEVADVISAEDNVGDELAVVAESDVGADGAVRAYRAGCGDLSAFGDDGCGMDAHSAVSTFASSVFFAARGTTWHMTVASQTRFAVDGDGAAHLDDAGAPVEDSDFNAELVAGGDGTAEAGIFDAGEDHELGFHGRGFR